MRCFLYLLLSLILLPRGTAAQSTLESRFDTTTASFEGTPAEQAYYLLRHVQCFGMLEESLDSLPAVLDSLLNGSLIVPKIALRAYLDSNAIVNAEIGGDLDSSLSTTLKGHSAGYFVIHDVSTPFYGEADFPNNIDSLSWRFNDMETWENNQAAHCFIGRTGASVAPHDFSTPWRATKFELRVLKDSVSKGRFLHCELVQPRRRDTTVSTSNDAIAPDPGFTAPQYERLALIYLCANARAGHALIPIFHAVLDEGIVGAHDDPQNFNLDAWCTMIQALILEIGAERIADENREIPPTAAPAIREIEGEPDSLE